MKREIPAFDGPEIRTFPVRDIEIRAAADEPYFEFRGYAAVFDSWSDDLGGFREQIKRGAFKDVLNDDVVMLWNHDMDQPLARGENLTLTEDPTGLKVEARIRADLSYGGDLRINLEEGTVSQMSFAFSGTDEEWVETEDGFLERTIKRFKRLFDVSPVTVPAYPATSAGLRSAAKLAGGGTVTDEEWAAIVALRSTDSTADDGGNVAEAQEPVVEDVAVDEPEVDAGDGGAGLSSVAAGRRIELLDLSAQL